MTGPLVARCSAAARPTVGPTPFGSASDRDVICNRTRCSGAYLSYQPCSRPGGNADARVGIMKSGPTAEFGV